jgi:hypothetical protein|tara:strand:+ start:5467 stop:6432 length:966 start_codon:yes stop_codon:yes gene_type:complete
MPAIEITDAKGLVQVTGTGVTSSSSVALTSTLSVDGELSKRTPRYLFRWNYIDCPQPFHSHAQSSDTATAAGIKSPMIWSGTNNEIYMTDLTRIGAYTSAVETPVIEGTVPAVDTASTAAGLNMQMDQDTAADKGWELNFGSPLGGGTAFTVGTHSGYIDMSVFCADWTAYDAVSIGFRKVEPVAVGHAPIIAAGTGDPVYTDFATFGLQESDKVQIATRINDTGTTSIYRDTTMTPGNSQNQRFRVTISTVGAVTYTIEQNGIANAGTMATPAGSPAAYTFDTGDVVIPYIFIHGANHADIALLVKHIEVYRDPGTLYVD